MRYNAGDPMLATVLKDCEAQYRAWPDAASRLDLTRGKPSVEQLELSLGLLDALTSRSILDSESGADCRNYGVLDGIPEAKRLMAELMGTHESNVLVGGNSSLLLMYLIFSHAMCDGLLGETPWIQIPERKFLCPVPGYDRHFAIAEHFGMKLLSVPMTPNGPDMDAVEWLAQTDETIKGIWCVPKYQNPTGAVYSPDTIRRFAALRPRAPDFRIFWDNAYCVHGLYPNTPDTIADLLTECEKTGRQDMVYEFCSTSKMAFPGGGISAVAASSANLNDLRGFLRYTTIGFDKLNQLRQVRFFKNLTGVRAHMTRQAAVLRPKFELCDRILTEQLGGLGIAEWTKPRGGYFLSLNTLPGCASEVVSLCAARGVTLTPAGTTYPYGHDPEDKNIRIAPSCAALSDLKPAMSLLSLAVKLAALHQLTNQ